MTSKSTLNKLATRNDHFRTRDGKEKRASLSWEVGYFAKITLEQHLQHREENADEIKQQIEEEATKKLREAVRSGDKQSEIEQQKKEDLKEKSDDIITGSRPTWEWPSGILSIRVQQITNLAIPNVRESGFKDDGGDEDGTGDLPSAYFTIILDHRQIYKSRTKMKSNSPYVGPFLLSLPQTDFELLGLVRCWDRDCHSQLVYHGCDDRREGQSLP